MKINVSEKPSEKYVFFLALKIFYNFLKKYNA